jgi:hypothetical protein
MQVVKPLRACHCLHFYERSLVTPVMLSLSGFSGQSTSGQTGEKILGDVTTKEVSLAAWISNRSTSCAAISIY